MKWIWPNLAQPEKTAEYYIIALKRSMSHGATLVALCIHTKCVPAPNVNGLITTAREKENQPRNIKKLLMKCGVSLTLCPVAWQQTPWKSLSSPSAFLFSERMSLPTGTKDGKCTGLSTRNSAAMVDKSTQCQSVRNTLECIQWFEQGGSAISTLFTVLYQTLDTCSSCLLQQLSHNFSVQVDCTFSGTAWLSLQVYNGIFDFKLVYLKSTVFWN